MKQAVMDVTQGGQVIQMIVLAAAAEPDMMGNKFVGLKKIGNDAEGRAIRENHHRRTFEKDRQRIDTHREYAEVDVHKRLLSARAVTKILEAAGLSPLIKELPAHE